MLWCLKKTREGNNVESNNFEMCILDGGTLDKVLTVPEKNLDEKKQKRIHEVTVNG